MTCQDSFFSAPLEPSWFPNLEALVVLADDEPSPSFSTLAACSSLRALVITADVHCNFSHSTLPPRSILCDVDPFVSIRAGLDTWPADRPIIHLRCAGLVQAEQLAELIQIEAPEVNRLKMVAVRDNHGWGEETAGEYERLEGVGRTKGVRVVREPQWQWDKFGFDYFLDEYAKPPAAERRMHKPEAGLEPK